jgi:hypothetical protein
MIEESKPTKARGVVDIVFLIDATGSMDPCIDALKTNISIFVDSMTTKSQTNPVRDWRAKVVGYRDFLDTAAPPLEDNPFVTDPEKLKLQLSSLKAYGGGDEPESLLDAIHIVANMGQSDRSAQELDPYKWRYRSGAARVVIVFTDATYHTTTKEGGTLDDINLSCTSNRILLFIFAPELSCYDDLASIDKSEYEPIEIEGTESPVQALVRYTQDTEAFRQAMEMLGKSVSASADVPEL